jgi:hypothetical protein
MFVLLLLACGGPGVVDGDGDLDGDGVADLDDCAPLDPNVFPGAPEVCNDLDDDCDGATDETFDLDGDGFLADEADCRAMGVVTDCDDTDAFVNPGAPEACDGVDNDCSGAADEAWDEDGDGVSPCGGDCDDDDPTRSPIATEVCDGRDNDCDDEADEGFDADGDAVSTCRGDCDDTDARVYPGAVEVCDGVDNDCDEATSEEGDLDGDGITHCDGDCDDNNAAALPGGVEVCDEADNDCNGATDELTECFGCFDVPPYTLCSALVTWEAADAACTDAGHTLVSVADAAENVVVSELAAAHLGFPAWIAYTDIASEGIWEWGDGSGTGFSSWAGGEPNNSGGEDCAATNWSGVYYWNDYPCSEELPFICE